MKYNSSVDPVADPGEQFPGTDESGTEEDNLVDSPDSVDSPDEEPEEVDPSWSCNLFSCTVII